ncbi:aminoglycoside phosphotransferase family protein [Actinomadura sp. WMMB 499]|uniref:phosphotransferase n=1 Tax=Actinomadura sp. WMMB 499 TaxID=1219491 RepID=UPI0012470F19|nr:aminoglycoside phosphotransferase family protein [Actinomadura sp. WMMB 499]QFG22416.1 aminoglycoside phosphotransferase family protein [Actinomadura sp. WMMB 499]
MSSQPSDGVTAVLDHLTARGMIPDPARTKAVPLTGGVSNDVFAVSGPGIDVVVKRALPVLRVAREWQADVARIGIEARALRLAHAETPEAVPAVVDFAGGYLVIERAPRSWTNWRDDLLSGVVDTAVARALGHALGVWQTRTAGQKTRLAGFEDRTVFAQLRTDPFHREVAATHRDLAPIVEETVDAMYAARDCLVHGDLSPKNVLASGGRMWVLDWEVAHLGDAAFDPAFLLSHLLLKSVHAPRWAGLYQESAAAFFQSYTRQLRDSLALDGRHLARQIGCLLIARVDGKSPAPYLTEAGRLRARELGRALLTGGHPQDQSNGVLNAWELIR